MSPHHATPDRPGLIAPVAVAGVDRVEGPLLFVTGTRGVGWDEYVRVRLPDGSVRHGVVDDVDGDLAVVEVFEGTDQVGTVGTVVEFTGSPLALPVTDRWLGRVCNGRGEPIDGGPPVTGPDRRPVSGATLNPAHRDVPRDPVITGISAIDGLTTLVRGQKLPIFSEGGLPHLELAIQIAAQATVTPADAETEVDGAAEAGPDTESPTAAAAGFSVVFAGMGITHADAELVRAGLEERVFRGEAALFLNLADDPPMERVLTPRLALTVAEHLAFDLGRHVLVVLTDMTSYCDAVRQLAAARGEVPSRQGYPGYLFSDLASIYERCGRLRGRPGSITELPVLTMPAGDITHPVPDLTGYITEGQVVLSTQAFARGVAPPIDPLASLSRMMRRGAGPGRTREDHLAIAAQVLALLDEARRAEQLAALIGPEALSITEQRYLDLARRFDTDVLDQPTGEARSLEETLDRLWRVARVVPERELTMVTPAQLAAYAPAEDEPDRPGGTP